MIDPARTLGVGVGVVCGLASIAIHVWDLLEHLQRRA